MKGRYVYGIAASGRAATLGPIGIENEEVYTIPHRGICALVHDCPPFPYDSRDPKTVERWVERHQRVLDAARGQFGAVIPLGFDVIVRSDVSRSADQLVAGWLGDNYDHLVSLLDRLRGKSEYGVQVSCDTSRLDAEAAARDERIRELSAQIASYPPGRAYMYQQKLLRLAKEGRLQVADDQSRELSTAIQRHCHDVVEGKRGPASAGRTMVLNLSCLVSEEKVEALGEELDLIRAMPGLSVHFSGPWPAYSFTGKTCLSGERKMERGQTPPQTAVTG